MKAGDYELNLRKLKLWKALGELGETEYSRRRDQMTYARLCGLAHRHERLHNQLDLLIRLLFPQPLSDGVGVEQREWVLGRVKQILEDEHYDAEGLSPEIERFLRDEAAVYDRGSASCVSLDTLCLPRQGEAEGFSFAELVPAGALLPLRGEYRPRRFRVRREGQTWAEIVLCVRRPGTDSPPELLDRHSFKLPGGVGLDDEIEVGLAATTSDRVRIRLRIPGLYFSKDFDVEYRARDYPHTKESGPSVTKENLREFIYRASVLVIELRPLAAGERGRKYDELSEQLLEGVKLAADALGSEEPKRSEYLTKLDRVGGAVSLVRGYLDLEHRFAADREWVDPFGAFLFGNTRPAPKNLTDFVGALLMDKGGWPDAKEYFHPRLEGLMRLLSEGEWASAGEIAAARSTVHELRKPRSEGTGDVLREVVDAAPQGDGQAEPPASDAHLPEGVRRTLTEIILSGGEGRWHRATADNLHQAIEAYRLTGFDLSARDTVGGEVDWIEFLVNRSVIQERGASVLSGHAHESGKQGAAPMVGVSWRPSRRAGEAVEALSQLDCRFLLVALEETDGR